MLRTLKWRAGVFLSCSLYKGQWRYTRFESKLPRMPDNGPQPLTSKEAPRGDVQPIAFHTLPFVTLANRHAACFNVPMRGTL